MLVNGEAPAIVVDCSGDGEIDRRDLICMGYEVISNQVKKRFIQAALFRACSTTKERWPGTDRQSVLYFEDTTGPSPQGVPLQNLFSDQIVAVDFDGTNPLITFPCPATSGRVTRPPSPP